MENKTHWKKLVNPDYLGAYSLNPGEEKILTMDKVTREKVVGTGGKKQECTVVHFKEPGVKPMILNRLNSKVITKIHQTPYIEEWTGKQIQIFVEWVDAFGEKVDALRIRPFIPQVGLPELKDPSPALDKAIEHIKKGGKLEEIRKHYTLTDAVKLILESHVK